MKTRIAAEYWVVDSDGDLVPAGPLVDASEGTGQRAANPLLEVRTPRCETATALRHALVERLEGVLETAARMDRRLVPLATPINGASFHPQSDAHDADGSRTRPPATAATDESIDCASTCAGARVQVERRRVTDQLNTLVALTPALALVNSSPYRRGERVANGARSDCYRVAQRTAGVDRRWQYVDSVDAWRQRLEQREEQSGAGETALAYGGDEPAVHTAPPADGSWTPVGLRDEPSALEWRAPDTALPSQLLRLTADLETVMDRLHRGMVHVGRYGSGERHRDTDAGDDITVGHVTNTEIALPRTEIVAELIATAIDVGLDATSVAAYLERMGFAVDDYHPIATRIDGRQYVTRADARELRLEYAGRLEEDVSELARSLG